MSLKRHLSHDESKEWREALIAVLIFGTIIFFIAYLATHANAI